MAASGGNFLSNLSYTDSFYAEKILFLMNKHSQKIILLF